MQNIYESGEYLRNNPDWHEGDAPHKARWIAAILARAGMDPAHVVEVGSGSGEVLVQLSRLLPAARLDGYDISPDAHGIANAKADQRIAFHHADYLACETARPDLLMAIDVFEHVEDYMGFLKALRTRADAHLFHIPLDLSVQGLLRAKPLMHARRSVGHLHYFDKDTALATLQDCGYSVETWNYTHGAGELPGKALRTRLMKLPRRLVRAVSEDFAVRLLGGSSMMVLCR